MVSPHDLSQEPLAEPQSPHNPLLDDNRLTKQENETAGKEPPSPPILDEDSSFVEFRRGDSHEFKMTFHRRF